MNDFEKIKEVYDSSSVWAQIKFRQYIGGFKEITFTIDKHEYVLLVKIESIIYTHHCYDSAQIEGLRPKKLYEAIEVENKKYVITGILNINSYDRNLYQDLILHECVQTLSKRDL